MLAKKFCDLCARHSRSIVSGRRKDFYSTASRKLTNAEIRKKRDAMFTEEKERQLNLVKRLEKISVLYNGHPVNEEGVHRLLMNMHVSTPYNCAMHIDEFLTKRSVIASVNGVPWEMHRPLVQNTDLELHHMLDENPELANQAFWNTGSFVLGSIIDRSFKDDVCVQLCDVPRTKVEDGCFMYDVHIDLPDWKPSQMELQCLGREGGRMWIKELVIEPLDVGNELALEMFEDNPYKIKTINQMLNDSSSGKVTLYRMGDFVDACPGPLISNTSQLSRFSVTAVHQLDCPTHGRVYRFQALALPMDLKMHWWAWDFVCRRAAKLNKTVTQRKMIDKSPEQIGDISSGEAPYGSENRVLSLTK